jgi:hypothetical protein
MKDNFDLQKYLTENKVFEEFNPFMAENARTDDEEDEKKSLRDKVREMILAELAGETELEEAKKDKPEEEVEDVELEDTAEFEPEPEEESTPDLEADEKAIMDNLEQALEFAKQKGDEKLIDQIGNTITFFTRQYIVK